MNKLFGLLLMCVSLTASAQDGWWWQPGQYDYENEGVLVTVTDDKLLFAIYSHWGPRAVEPVEIPPTISPEPPPVPSTQGCTPGEIPPTISPAPPPQVTLLCDDGMPFWVFGVSDLFDRELGIASGYLFFSPNFFAATEEGHRIGQWMLVRLEDGSVELTTFWQRGNFSNFDECNPLYGTRTLTRLIRPAYLEE